VRSPARTWPQFWTQAERSAVISAISGPGDHDPAPIALERLSGALMDRYGVARSAPPTLDDEEADE